MSHAILAPSAASRWTKCTPSARLEQQFENLESDYAREGTLAHSIGEALLRGYVESSLILLTLDQLNFFKKQEFYTEAMYEHCQSYASYVLCHYNIGDILLIEQKLDLSGFIPESFGTSDASILKVKTKELHVFDLKYGKGVEVLAFDNTQLKVYALGVLKELEFFGYDIRTVTLHIYQPRINETPEPFTLTVKELFIWAVDVLRPAALEAWEGTGEFVPGNHCLFCNANAKCRALANYNLELAKHDFEDPALLKDAEIITIYERRKLFDSWIKAVDAYMLAQALKGKTWTGYKLVEGKSNRQYKDEALVARTLINNLNFGYVSEIYKPKELLGITELTAKIGTENFNKLVAPLLRKPPGAPTLAPLDDKRGIYNPALIDFREPYVEPVEDFSDL